MKRFAVFDIDGTLIRWQLYHNVVDKLAGEGAISSSEHAKVKAARMKWKRRESLDEFHEYEAALIQVYERSLKRIKPSIFDSCVKAVIREYKDQTYLYTRTLLHDLKKQGYLLFAISGSHHELIELLAKYYEFDDFIGTQYIRGETRFTGEKITPAHDKRSALLAMIGRHKATLSGSYAIGDSLGDVPMLELVENPVAFNPDQALFKVATTKGWNIVVERKNVIYMLEESDGKYLLA